MRKWYRVNARLLRLDITGHVLCTSFCTRTYTWGKFISYKLLMQSQGKMLISLRQINKIT